MRTLLLLWLLANVGCASFAQTMAQPMDAETAQALAPREQPKRDMQCVNSCVSRGFLLDFCNSKCSY